MNNSSLSSEKDLRQDSRSDFTQGSILGKLVPFMLPILGALILQAAYGAVDLLEDSEQHQVFPLFQQEARCLIW